MTSTYVLRAFDAVVDDVNQEDRTILARINTDEVDRYKTVIAPRGGRFDNYTRLGGPVLWEHGKDPRRGNDPIGRNLWIKSDGQKRPTLLAKTRFLTDDFSQQRYEWYRDGVLRAFSVNILPDPDSVSSPTREEIGGRPELADCHTMYRTWDLAEYSGVVIPGNASALAYGRAVEILSCVERGLWLPDSVLEELRSITKSLVLDGEPQMRGGDDAAQTQGEDEEDEAVRVERVADSLKCTERHALGHCPECGDPSVSEDDGYLKCSRDHKYRCRSGIACPYKEPERSAPVSEPTPELVLPDLSGRSFGEIHASLAMLVRSTRAEILKDIKEQIDLLHGRV